MIQDWTVILHIKLNLEMVTHKWIIIHFNSLMRMLNFTKYKIKKVNRAKRTKLCIENVKLCIENVYIMTWQLIRCATCCMSGSCEALNFERTLAAEVPDVTKVPIIYSPSCNLRSIIYSSMQLTYHNLDINDIVKQTKIANDTANQHKYYMPPR